MLSTIAKRPMRHHRRTAHQHFNSAIRHNIWETDKTFEIDVAIPGFSRENFEIKWDHGQLIVAFERPESTTELRYLRKGFDYDSFERAFKVKSHLIDTEAIAAEYTNGILRITLPKSDAGLNLVRTITID